MSQRLTRKEIKRDEFREAVASTLGYAEHHLKAIIWGAVGLVVLAAAGVGVFYYLQHRESLASAALAEAVDVLNAPIQAEAAKPDDADNPSFKDEATRLARAKELLEAVQQHFGSTEAAGVADLYLARIAADGGNLDEARKRWQSYVDEHPGNAASGEARLNLIDLDLQQGKADQAIAALKKMLEASEKPLPGDVLLFELGRSYERADRSAEALQTYRRLIEEYPQSTYLAEAQQKASELGGGPPAAVAGNPFGA